MCIYVYIYIYVYKILNVYRKRFGKIHTRLLGVDSSRGGPGIRTGNKRNIYFTYKI